LLAAIVGIIGYREAWEYITRFYYLYALLAVALTAIYAALRSRIRDLRHHARTHATLWQQLWQITSLELAATAAAIRQILTTHRILRATCDAIHIVPDECRATYGSGVATAATAWARTLAIAQEDESGAGADLLSSVFRKYMDEEARDISGEAYDGRRVVVTNFVAYSSLVRALVDETAHRFDGQHIVCFTTLTMPLPRWFNYIESKAIADPDQPRYVETDPRWVTYTDEVRKLVHEKGSVTLLRHLLCLSSAGQYRHGHPPRLAIGNTEHDLEAQGQYHLLEPRSGEPTKPFDADELLKKCTAAGVDRAPFGGSAPGYLVASNLPANPPEVPNYKWTPLWQAFALGYHKHIPNCRVNVLLDTDADDWLLRDVKRSMPEDFFAVGIGAGDRLSEIKWLACLGADTNVAMDLVSLELMTPTLCPDRFRILRDYISWLSENGVGIDRWFKERSRAVA
jgi:hypothetical protein